MNEVNKAAGVFVKYAHLPKAKVSGDREYEEAINLYRTNQDARERIREVLEGAGIKIVEVSPEHGLTCVLTPGRGDYLVPDLGINGRKPNMLVAMAVITILDMFFGDGTIIDTDGTRSVTVGEVAEEMHRHGERVFNATGTPDASENESDLPAWVIVREAPFKTRKQARGYTPGSLEWAADRALIRLEGLGMVFKPQKDDFWRVTRKLKVVVSEQPVLADAMKHIRDMNQE